MITYDRVRELLWYEPDTGLLWRTGRNESCGRALQISLDGRLYPKSRVIWLWMTGSWPPALVDHKDRCNRNNKWDNLRAATYQQNTYNRAPVVRSLPKGVYSRNGRFVAMIRVDGILIYLGQTSTVEEAESLYTARAAVVHGEYASGK